MSSLDNALKLNDLVPSIIPRSPGQVLQVAFPSGVTVQEGNQLTPTQVKDTPTLSWTTDADSFYTLVFTDPDAPSRSDQSWGQWRHWLVANIPGTDVARGDTITSFISSGPAKDSGLHRYLFLVYKQPCRITTDPSLSASRFVAMGREKWNVAEFALQHGLGDPVAGNMYLAEWDEYVPQLQRSLVWQTVRSCSLL